MHIKGCESCPNTSRKDISEEGPTERTSVKPGKPQIFSFDRPSLGLWNFPTNVPEEIGYLGYVDKSSGWPLSAVLMGFFCHPQYLFEKLYYVTTPNLVFRTSGGHTFLARMRSFRAR